MFVYDYARGDEIIISHTCKTELRLRRLYEFYLANGYNITVETKSGFIARKSLEKIICYIKKGKRK